MLTVDSVQEWPKAEKLLQWCYDDGAECYLISYGDNDEEISTPVEDVTMMIISDDEYYWYYDVWTQTHEKEPIEFVEALSFVNKETGERLYFDVYEVEKHVRGKTVGYELLTETYKK